MNGAALFGIRNGIGPNMPTICFLEEGGRKGHVYCYRITWVGAYFGAFWRNLLGRFYVPFSPDHRREIDYHRKQRGAT